MPQQYKFLAPNDMKDFIEYTADNFDSQDEAKRNRANYFIQKWNLDQEELDKYRNARWLPNKISNPLKAKIYDKVASKELAISGVPSPVSWLERFSVKGMIDEDPDYQIQYLKRKGYDARINSVTGELEAKKPGDFYQPVDEEDIGIGDLFDIIPDLITGGIEGIVTGYAAGKAGGLVKAIPIGGAAAGMMEAAKQETARAMGLRDDIDYGRIGAKTAMGTIIPAAVRFMGLLPKSAYKNYKFDPKSNIDEINAVGKEMGATPTSGMLNANRRGQEVEDLLWNQRPVNLYNEDLVDQIDANIKATDQYATNLFKERTGGSKIEAGTQIQQSISAKLNQKKEMAEALYDELETKLGLPGFKVNNNPLSKTLDVLEEGFKFDKTGRAWVAELREEIDKIKTIKDLRLLNTRLNNDVAKYKMVDPSLSGASSILGQRSKALIDESFNDILDKKMTMIGRVPAEKAAQFERYINGLRGKLKDANRLYREVNEEAGSILRRPGSAASKERGSATTKIEKIENQKVEKMFTDVYANGDVKKAKWMAEKFPREHAIARGAKMQEIWQKAIDTQGKQSLGSKLSQRIRALSDSEKLILFGEDGIKKAQNLATWFAEKPIVVNPSGTAKGLEMVSWVPTLMKLPAAANAFRHWMGQPNNPLTKVVGGLGYLIDNPITRGGAYLGGSQLIPTKKDASEKNTFP